MRELIEIESRRWRAGGVVLCMLAASVWVVIGSSSAAKSEKTAEAIELFAKADQRFNFHSPGGPPIRIEQQFSVWTRKLGTVQGTETLIWAGIDHWKETLKVQDYFETTIRGHASQWRLRSQPIPTLEAWKGGNLVNARIDSDWPVIAKAGGVREVHAGQTIEKCASVSWKQGGDSKLCFDPVNGDLLSSTSGVLNNETRFEWDDFIDVGGHSIPRHTREYLNGKLIGRSAATNATVLVSVDSESFVPPDGAEESPACEHPMPAAFNRHEANSIIPAMYSGIQGAVTFYIKVDGRGNVVTVGVMEPLDPKRDEKAMRIIKNEWKFKPTTCGQTPIPSELEEVFTFKSS